MKKITFLVLLSLISFSAWAKSDVDKHLYSIQGSTCDELKQQMRIFGPSHDETNYDGATEWQLIPDWKVERKGERWKVGAAEFNLKMTYHLPNWINKDKADSILQKEWGRFLEALIKHEKGHADYGVRAAAAIERTVLALPSATTREEINKKADRVARNILSQFLEKEKSYDQETKHGLTQGVRFCQ